MKRHILTTYLLLSACMAGTVLAGDGRIPIWEPIVITEPGSYVVTRNIAATTTVIDVQTEGVTIDLNGFVLESTDPVAPVIRLRPSATESGSGPHFISLHGPGELHGPAGIDAEDIRELSIERLSLERNTPPSTFPGLDFSRIHRLALERVGLDGFGFKLDGDPAFPTTGHVGQLTVKDASGSCFEAKDARALIMARIAVHMCGDVGIALQSCDACSLEQPTVVGASTHGVFVGGSTAVWIWGGSVDNSGLDSFHVDGSSNGGNYFNIVGRGSSNGWGFNNFGDDTMLAYANLHANALGGVQNNGTRLSAQNSSLRGNGGPGLLDLGADTWLSENCAQ